jgi:REP element-mobilizing transposase RayT
MKRIYIKNAAYLLTTNCEKWFPYFVEDVFCNILIDNIAICQRIKPFELIGFKINPDHTHLIIQPTGDYNISQIMQNIKRVTSDHINQIINFDMEINHYEKLKWTDKLKVYNKMFIRKNNYQQGSDFPIFKWQEGFDDQLIREEEQLKNSTSLSKSKK